MKFKFIRTIIAAAVLTAALGVSGCEFGTYVKTDKLPETSVAEFFDSLKNKDLVNCDKYLADDNSFAITNGTGLGFADIVLNAQLESLDYEIAGNSKINGGKASCRVKITSLDVSNIETAMTNEYPKVRSQYIIENDLEDFSTDDKEALNEVVSNTFNQVIDSIEPTQKEITLELEFQDGMWKIISDNELCAVIFGGDSE